MFSGRCTFSFSLRAFSGVFFDLSLAFSSVLLAYSSNFNSASCFISSVSPVTSPMLQYWSANMLVVALSSAHKEWKLMVPLRTWKEHCPLYLSWLQEGEN